MNSRYRIFQDGAAAFVRARDLKVGRDVVIRSRPRQVNGGSLRREARVLERAARTNPNVPRVLDRWVEADEEHLVLDYVPGTPLDDVLRQGGIQGKPYFAPEVAQRLIWGLIKGLSVLHRNGICHGDLKPANLVVARGNRLVMIDFGSAWSGGAPVGGRDRGTPGYAAPEQWREANLVDARADQFSVSVIAYQMFTNELPWDGLGGSVREHLKGRVPAPTPMSQHQNVRARGAASLRTLDGVIARGLSIEKDDRFETTSAWLRAFEAAGQQQQARRDTKRRADITSGAIHRLLARVLARFRGSP